MDRALTLRSKSRRRPKISAPKPIANPTPNNTPVDPERPQNDATSDLVKRRYSARFNQAPDLDNAPPVPSIPSVAQYAQPLKPSPEPGEPPKVDLSALQDPSLPVDRCECPILSIPNFSNCQMSLVS